MYEKNRRYQGKAWSSALLPPLISGSDSGSMLEINIASAFVILFSIHDLCYSNTIFIVDIIIISPNARSPAIPMACIYETLFIETWLCCFVFWHQRRWKLWFWPTIKTSEWKVFKLGKTSMDVGGIPSIPERRKLGQCWPFLGQFWLTEIMSHPEKIPFHMV